MKTQPDQLDLFIATASDVSPKEHRDLMSRCWFNLAKQKRTTPIEHRFVDNWVRISGNQRLGIASIFENDVLLYVIAQYINAINHDIPVGRRFQFTGYEFFKFIGRKSFGGKAYADLWHSLERLHHTFVETNIRHGDSRKQHSFNWLSEIKQIAQNGASSGYEVVIPEWLYESVVEHKQVLTLNAQYFTIKGGLERWLYLFARKSAGKQKTGWSETLQSVYRKSGSSGSYAEFKRSIYKIIGKGSILDYELSETHSVRGEYYPRMKDGIRFLLKGR